MDPTNRTPDAARPGEGRTGTGSPVPAQQGEETGQSPAPVRVVQLVAGDYLLTVNPVDGSEIEPCPPGRMPPPARRHDPEARAERDRAAVPPPPAGAVRSGAPLIGRAEVRERLGRLLSRGRSVRLTGPAGSGRTALLDVLAADCAHLAPDGVVRLNGRHRTTADLLHELFAAVHHAPLHRPDRAGLPAAVREIGAVVVLDDLEFGGAALDELLDATPECAFLFAARPDVPAPSADAHVEEVVLDGLDRTECLELLETAVDRPLTDEEADWAADLWVESDGLPLRFVQAGALLRRLDSAASDADAADGERPFSIPEDGVAEGDPSRGGEGAPAGRREPLPRGTAPAAALAARLSDSARETLRFALALGGEVPHQAQLPALVGDEHADAAVAELFDGGLITVVGAHYRVAAGVAGDLAAADRSEGAAERVLAAARHYAWWAGHPSVTPERIAAEADVVLAALAALVTSGAPGHPAAAVLLARTAAPAFAGALHWSAWERGLRHGQEAARLAGEVGEEAYFHHELGVLALCTGNLGRARAELEASTGLRGVLADKRGAVASRRALALVADRSRPAPAPTPVGRPGGPAVRPPAAPAGGPRGSAGEEVPAARSEQSAAPPAGPAPFTTDPDRVATAAINRVPAPRAGTGAGAPPAGGKRGGRPQAWVQKLMAGGGRRNLAAAGAGVVLAAVLGTVVSLGTSAGGGESGGGDQDAVKPDRSASQQDGEPDLTADHPVGGGGGPAPMRGRGGASERVGTQGPSGAPSGTPSGSTSPSPSGTASPDDSPSPTRTPGGGHSTGPTRTPGGGESTKTQPPTTPSEPTDTPKTEPPVTQKPTPPAGGGDSAGSGTVKPSS
ncbi:ATP-binding protein [Streptomyces mobaraensis NBRC 13819 = DSM 40847]|uniref:ATPase AAA n=1 Tax=Streptomyces mobaraensis (strain ATCC 29032 / DSM 40847 / JCM 4168 / NBRC 13819 / NCIMB 11159 / IPCR 16-22) TaxID=1223523 RepID=M3AV44_STRM1|nr:ATP-binding protein [Streptomyces mobaraensis]EME97447.1 hypothetical protein H340_26409 [Streptomyces mobaraensis NBRC 13819 = DSM 40847]QTT75746.1 ATP-binding protein [Streptomyces mobaraensis NBRC 13819 = DSM 40847]